MTVFTVPSSIDQTGTSEVSASLQAWVNGTVLNGTTLASNTVRFQPGAIYWVERGLDFTARSNLIIDLNGGKLLVNLANPFGIEASSGISNSRFSYFAHGLVGTAPIKITGGVVNTTGIVNNGVYWPVAISVNSFLLSLTQNGSAVVLGGTTDTKINMSNAGSPNPRQFLLSSSFPGNENFARCNITVEGDANVRVTNGTLQGASTAGTSGVYDLRYAGQLGVCISGGTGIEIDHLTITGTLGDSGECLFSALIPHNPSVCHIHHNIMIGACRQGFSVGNGGATDIIIEDNQIIGSARHLLDIEADDPDGNGDIQRITVRRNYFRGGANTSGWIAAGGESKVVTDIVIGGLEGHPEDGNVVVAVPMSFNSPTPTGVRRGPIMFGYNIGGGTVTIGTVAGSTTVTGVFNTSTTMNPMRLQTIKASGLPIPCQINTIVDAGHAILSHPATATGTVLATYGSEFQGVAPVGAFGLRRWDGVTVIGNHGTLQAGRGIVGTLVDNCTGYTGAIHGNVWTGGGELQAINVAVVSGTAKLVGGGLLRAVGSPVPAITGSAKLVGGGLLRATGTNVPPISGSAVLAGGGVLKLIGGPVPDILGSAALVGGGLLTLIGAPVPDILGSAVLDGGGLLHAIGTVVPDTLGSAALVGGGILQMTGSDPVTFGAATLIGGGTLTAIGANVPDILGSAVLIGGGTFHAIGTSVPAILGSATLVGGGTLAAIGTSVPATFGSLFLQGGGTLEAVGAPVPATFGSAVLVGGGILELVLTQIIRGLPLDAPVALDTPLYYLDGTPVIPVTRSNSLVSIAASTNSVTVHSGTNSVTIDS